MNSKHDEEYLPICLSKFVSQTATPVLRKWRHPCHEV